MKKDTPPDVKYQNTGDKKPFKRKEHFGQRNKNQKQSLQNSKAKLFPIYTSIAQPN